MRRIWLAVAALAVGASGMVAATGVADAATPGTNELVSIRTSGQQGNDISGRFAGPAINGNGSVVAFDSIAKTLVAGDTNKAADVFVRDRGTGVTERVSVSTSGVQANGTSIRPALDASGNLVVFDSSATNLAGPDTNSSLDVFVRDRAAGTTSRLSVSGAGVPGNEQSNTPSISADGRYVSFVSRASNLVPNDTNNVDDIFVRDLVAGTIERVSVTTGGQEGNSSTTAASISADGRWVAFSSFANNLVPGDTNDTFDVFLHDRQTGVTEMASVGTSGALPNGESSGPGVSADGQLVTFWSDATNLVPNDTNDRKDVFVRNRTTGTTERVSVSSSEEQADGTNEEPGVRGTLASSPDITPDGRFVAFFSSATNLVPGDTNTCPLFFDEVPGRCPDAFVRDLVNGTTTRVNVAADGTEANDRTADPAISDDGSAVAFFSAANNLAPGDTNTCPLFTSFPGNCPDIFVHDIGIIGPGTADLSVSQTDSPDPVAVGARLRYTVTVSNGGPDDATLVSVVDRLPDGVSFLAARTTGGLCTQSTPEEVRCSLGTVPAGTQVVIEIDVRPLQLGAIRNTVRVASPNDSAVTNNTSVQNTQVRNKATAGRVE